MCKRYPGLRCGNPIHERLESLISQVEEAKAFRDALNPDEVRKPEITKARNRLTLLEARLKDAQAKYDVTDSGFSTLEASAEDESLSNAERTAIKVRLKDAAKERAERAKAVSDSEARRANVVYFLEQAGVPANERAAFDDANIYIAAAGSAKHYETIKNNRFRAYEARLAEYNKALAKAQTPAGKAKVEETEGLAVEKAKSDFNRALHRYDSTGQGIEALKAKVAKASVCYTAKDEANLTRLELRLANAEKAHRQNLDHRNLRNSKLAELKAVVSAHGLSTDDALKAFKNKMPLPKIARKRVSAVAAEAMRTSKVQSHITQRDLAAIDSAFKRSDEYKQGGEAARADFLRRLVMTPPSYSRESLDAVDARTVLGSNGQAGRNHTVIEQGKGIPRDRLLGICLTKYEADQIQSQANSLHTSVSALMRDKLLGQSPVGHENDRSVRVRRMKRQAVSERLMNEIPAAA